jgi:glycosyltransferase involved in cell wall biosynthesis
MIQATLVPFGGANAVSAWVLEALKQNFEITLLLCSPVNLKAINQYYGTTLQPSEMKILVFPAWLRCLVNGVPGDPWNFQGYALLMRWCRRISTRYDVVISCSDETDFGVRGIQYVHYPYQEENWAREPGRRNRSHFFEYGLDWLRTRSRPWRILSGFSFRRMKENLTLVNSQWTRDLYWKVYGVDSVVVYPPVPGAFPTVSWDKRENGFVCIGRISAEKRTETLIDIVAAIHAQFPDVHLHVIGYPAAWDRHVYTKVKKRVMENPSWIFLHENIPLGELASLVGEHRYGIHGMRDEHFGIGVAEMVRGGCVPFVPDSGGQVEIVGHAERLLWKTPEEAVRKILHVLRNSDAQTELIEHLRQRRDVFTTERFVDRIREVVREFASQGSSCYERV